MYIPEAILIEIIKTAEQYSPIYKIVLYGSRARGDHTPTSDIDLAVYSSEQQAVAQFAQALEENTNTLLKFDVACIRPDSNPEFLKHIQKDGVILMSTFAEKYDLFAKAVAHLKEATEEYRKTKHDLMRDGVIQRFEYTAELAWKTTRAYLLEQGVLDVKLPKAVMKEAYAAGLIENDGQWNELLQARNLTSHLYDEALVAEIYQQIEQIYLPLLEALLQRL